MSGSCKPQTLLNLPEHFRSPSSDARRLNRRNADRLAEPAFRSWWAPRSGTIKYSLTISSEQIRVEKNVWSGSRTKGLSEANSLQTTTLQWLGEAKCVTQWVYIICTHGYFVRFPKIGTRYIATEQNSLTQTRNWVSLVNLWLANLAGSLHP